MITDGKQTPAVIYVVKTWREGDSPEVESYRVREPPSVSLADVQRNAAFTVAHDHFARAPRVADGDTVIILVRINDGPPVKIPVTARWEIALEIEDHTAPGFQIREFVAAPDEIAKPGDDGGETLEWAAPKRPA